MNESLNKRMRRELVPGAGHIMPGAGNALAARMIEGAGHGMLMVSGAAVANSYLGVPDIGLVSVTEFAGHVAAVRDAVGIPILADADTGFGNAINTRRTVQLLERAGANAIMLEDQTFPKRCGHFDGKDVVDHAGDGIETQGRPGRTRRSGPDDSRSNRCARDRGLRGGAGSRTRVPGGGRRLPVHRGAGHEAGAARHSSPGAGNPLCNMVVGGKTPLASREELAEAGYAVILYANAALQASMLAMQEVLQHLHVNGSVAGIESRLMTFSARQEALDVEKYRDLESRYA